MLQFLKVYKHSCIKNIEIAPNIAVFIDHIQQSQSDNGKIATPTATLTDILPDGTGLFLVRSISRSKSFQLLD
jgi:hypothetical protein